MHDEAARVSKVEFMLKSAKVLAQSRTNNDLVLTGCPRYLVHMATNCIRANDGIDAPGLNDAAVHWRSLSACSSQRKVLSITYCARKLQLVKLHAAQLRAETLLCTSLLRCVPTYDGSEAKGYIIKC